MFKTQLPQNDDKALKISGEYFRIVPIFYYAVMDLQTESTEFYVMKNHIDCIETLFNEIFKRTKLIPYCVNDNFILTTYNKGKNTGNVSADLIFTRVKRTAFKEIFLSCIHYGFNSCFFSTVPLEGRTIEYPFVTLQEINQMRGKELAPSYYTRSAINATTTKFSPCLQEILHIYNKLGTFWELPDSYKPISREYQYSDEAKAYMITALDRITNNIFDKYKV